MEKRLSAVATIFMLLLGLMALRAIDLQLLRADKIIAQAQRRFSHTVSLTPHRGKIQDRDGQPLAVSLEVKSIAVNAGKIENKERVAGQLAKTLDIDRARLLKRLKSDKHFVWIKRHATPDEVAAVKALGIKEIGFYNETKRFYPESESMANLIGIVGIDGNGLEGLELMYDHVLTGKQRQAVVQRDGHGRTIYARGLVEDAPRDGHALTLSIDRRIQYAAFDELKNTIRDNNARSGFVIITNPNTGEIYAMASYPSFNPNLGSYKDMSGHRNRAVVDVFEPGSIMKPLWISWGISNGIFRPSQIVFCENGKYTFSRVTINDADHKYGWLPIRDVIKFSSNIGMVKLMEPIKPSQMYSALQDFNLSQPTGISYPGEAKGLIRSPERWTSVDKAAISFGQGFAVSGIQVITAFNAMVNGGQIIKPLLVSSIKDEGGQSSETFRPTIVRKVITNDASQEILNIMKSVVLKGGTGATAYMENYQVFGKTGTAQKTDPLTGTYSKNAYISSFIGGITDATGRPAATMLIVIDEPHPNYYASIVTCPAFKRIATKLVNIMDIRPVITVAKGDAS